jgi:hypothetical protein
VDPTDAFYKTKRNLLLFIGGLFLAIFAGFKISNGEQKISVLPFQLERPELLAAILCIAVLFNLFQFSLQWAPQKSEVQSNRFHRIDFISTATIGGISILCFLWSLIGPHIRFDGTTAFGGFGVAIAVLMGGLISFLGSSTLEKASKQFGRWIKLKAKTEDEKLSKLLVSNDEWVLNYNPKNSNAVKMMSFDPDGEVLIGKNDNEASWRVKNGLLEFLNSKGEVFSRFQYDEATNTFNHTNDPDTKSIRSQTLSSNEDGILRSP